METETDNPGVKPPPNLSFPAEYIPDAGDALQIVSVLSHAQDREDLDIQLVHVLKEMLRPATTTYYRLIPHGSDSRILLSVELRRGSMKPLLARSWDPDALPRLSGRPDLHRCNTEQTTLRVESTSGRRPRALLPVFGASQVVGIVELMLDHPLTMDQERLALLVLTLYRNQLTMIDYAQRDTLTGLLNRKTFETSFSTLIAAVNGHTRYDYRVPFLGRRRPPNEHQKYWIAMLDIDHFKRINDTLGHAFGDEVLLILAKILRGSFRVHDQLYRFGGEEFVVVLHRTEPDYAKQVFERLRDKVEKHVFPQIPNVTISMGYTQIQIADSPSLAFSRADTAMYYAKSHGRNKVCQYEELVALGHIVENHAYAGLDLFAP